MHVHGRVGAAEVEGCGARLWGRCAVRIALKESTLGSNCHRLGARVYSQLVEDRGQVVVDRARGDGELAGDQLAGEALGHQPQYLDLACGQWILVRMLDLCFSSMLSRLARRLRLLRMRKRLSGFVQQAQDCGGHLTEG